LENSCKFTKKVKHPRVIRENKRLNPPYKEFQKNLMKKKTREEKGKKKKGKE
jgi:hypothetical protein